MVLGEVPAGLVSSLALPGCASPEGPQEQRHWFVLGFALLNLTGVRWRVKGEEWGTAPADG